MEFHTLLPLISRVSRQPTHLLDPIEQMQIECALFLGRFAQSCSGKEGGSSEVRQAGAAGAGIGGTEGQGSRNRKREEYRRYWQHLVS